MRAYEGVSACCLNGMEKPAVNTRDTTLTSARPEYVAMCWMLINMPPTIGDNESTNAAIVPESLAEP